MSWSGSTTIPAGATEREAHQAINLITITGNDDHKTERDRAVATAKDAAARIITSGVLGDTSKGFTVSLGGHANKDHEPEGNWASDYMSINITRAK